LQEKRAGGDGFELRSTDSRGGCFHTNLSRSKSAVELSR
jgi:hypothetical protein